MTDIRMVDGMLHTGEVFALDMADEKSTRRLVSHLITRRRWFVVECIENSWVVFVSVANDLEGLRKRLPGVKYTLAD